MKFELRDAPDPAAGPALTSTNLTEDQRRRLALARWIVHPANPLTARVMVNRLWQYHFGERLVSTPNDFGANGWPGRQSGYPYLNVGNGGPARIDGEPAEAGGTKLGSVAEFVGNPSENGGLTAESGAMSFSL